MTCKAIFPVLAFLFVWGNVAPGRAWSQAPPWARPFRREGAPPKAEAPKVEAPKPAPPPAEVPKPEPPKPAPPRVEPPKPTPPAPVAVRTAKSRVLVCPHLSLKGTEAAAGTAAGTVGRTFCLSREKAGELASDTLVLVARIEEGTNQLLRFALTYQADMSELDFWSDAPLEDPQKNLESALDEGEWVQSVNDGDLGRGQRTGGPGPLRGLGSVVPMADVAVAAVLTVIADLAVSKAKALALDIARDQVIGACDRLRERGVMAHLCDRFRHEPLLDLIKDRKVLQAAVVADALDYVATRQAKVVPAPLQPAVGVALGLLRDAAATGRVPRPDTLRGLWEALQGSLETLDPEGALGSVLWVSTTLMLTALETGTGPAVLEWTVFRDFREPSPSDRKYLAAYLEAMAWAAGVLEEKWPSPCDGKDEAMCRAARQARADQLDFTLGDFGRRHPQYVLEQGVFDRLDRVVRWRHFQDPGIRRLYDRFRVLLQEPEPRVWLREALGILFEVIERELRERLEVLAAPPAKGSPDPAPARRRLKAGQKHLESLRRLVFAVAEGDHAGILRGFIDLLQSGEAALPRGLRTGIATLRLIIGLLEPDAPGEKPEQAQKRRVALLQEFADQMTSRRGRHREWIASLGVSAFAGGGVSWSGDGAEGAFSPVSLPLGVSFQWYGPSGHGFHVMAYPLDVAQYTRVNASGDEAAMPSPSLYTALTFGVQLAWARLLRDVPFTIGLDLRYIPYLAYDEKNLLEDGTEEIVTRTRRHFQVMGFVGFHFPILDFN